MFDQMAFRTGSLRMGKHEHPARIKMLHKTPQQQQKENNLKRPLICTLKTRLVTDSQSPWFATLPISNNL